MIAPSAKTLFWAYDEINRWIDANAISGAQKERDYQIATDRSVSSVTETLKAIQTLKRQENYETLLIVSMSACNLCLQQHGIVSRYLVKNIFDAYLCANEFYRAFYLAYRIATLLSKTGGYYQPWVDCIANIINPCNQIIEGSQNLEYLRGYLASFWDGEHWNDYQFCKAPSEIYNECRFVVNAYRLLKC